VFTAQHIIVIPNNIIILSKCFSANWLSGIKATREVPRLPWLSLKLPLDHPEIIK